jgi:hypothetical protein
VRSPEEGAWPGGWLVGEGRGAALGGSWYCDACAEMCVKMEVSNRRMCGDGEQEAPKGGAGGEVVSSPSR